MRDWMWRTSPCWIPCIKTGDIVVARGGDGQSHRTQLSGHGREGGMVDRAAHCPILQVLHGRCSWVSRGSLARTVRRPSWPPWVVASIPEIYEAQLERIHDDGFQAATHAIGDSAARLVLGAYQRVLGGPNDKRWRMEHAQVIHPDDFNRFGRPASFRPCNPPMPRRTCIGQANVWAAAAFAVPTPMPTSRISWA